MRLIPHQGNHYPDGRPKYEWFNGWTDEELLSADYLGVYHREDKDKNKPVCAAVDFDDKDYVAHDWNIKLPMSMSVVKETKLDKVSLDEHNSVLIKPPITQRSNINSSYYSSKNQHDVFQKRLV